VAASDRWRLSLCRNRRSRPGCDDQVHAPVHGTRTAASDEKRAGTKSSAHSFQHTCPTNRAVSSASTVSRLDWGAETAVAIKVSSCKTDPQTGSVSSRSPRV